MCEPKLVGISIELVYEDGKFISGSTRGDGVIGEDVTLNLRTIDNVPKDLKGTNIPERIAVRGECMMHIKDFQDLNKRQVVPNAALFRTYRALVLPHSVLVNPGLDIRGVKSQDL